MSAMANASSRTVAATGSDVMIETRGLTKVYGSLVAVDSLCMAVREGEIHGLVGPNGAGKSTLLKLLVGAIRCTRGEGYIKGHLIGSVEARRVIGYSPERPSFYRNMTAWDYLVHMAGLSGMKIGEAEDRADELLDWLDLSDFSDAVIGGFSAGMKQRLSVAQAMAHRPGLLILDEPTANLDPGGRMSLLEKLKSLPAEQNVTVLISSHILSELEYLVDTVTFLDRGRVVSESGVEVLKGAMTLDRYVLHASNSEALAEALRGVECVQEVRLGSDGVIHITSQDMGMLQVAVLEAVVRCGAVVKHFGEEQVRLEDVYRDTMAEERDR